MPQTRLRENKIGEHIYNRIKEYDMVSRKVFLGKLTEEEKKLYDKYKNMINKRNSLAKDPEKQKIQKEQAKEGMKTYRAKLTKEEIKEKRKPYDEKYREKKKLSKEEAVRIIQKHYRKKKEAEAIVKDILTDIIDAAPNMKIVNGELKKKRGRKIK
jgi:hypothetical protein